MTDISAPVIFSWNYWQRAHNIMLENMFWTIILDVFFLDGASAPIRPRPSVFKVPELHTLKCTQTVGHIWKSDQPIPDTATYTAHTQHKSQIAMPSAGFETMIPPLKRLQANALNRTANRSGLSNAYLLKTPIYNLVAWIQIRAQYETWRLRPELKALWVTRHIMSTTLTRNITVPMPVFSA